jgi:SepF-like predicted cell division protein (DUF552 family)
MRKMGVKNWLGFEESDETIDLEEYLENISLHDGEILDEDKYNYVKSIKVTGPNTIEDVEREVKKGNIAILDTESLAQSDRLTLKKLIGDMKKLEDEVDGDMGRISETKILFVPSGFRILKRQI